MPKTEVVELPSYVPVIGPAQPQLRNGIMQPKITGTEIQDGTIFARALVVGAQGWIHNLTWTATDSDTASWSSGTIQFADGNSTAISAGNTGNIAGTTYIYYNGTTTLQTSTTYSDAVGDNNVLLAIVESVTDGKCVITAMFAAGTTIDGDRITTGKIQSTDTRTYFDLDNDQIIMNDGSNDRILIGYQSGGF